MPFVHPVYHERKSYVNKLPHEFCDKVITCFLRRKCADNFTVKNQQNSCAIHLATVQIRTIRLVCHVSPPKFKVVVTTKQNERAQIFVHKQARYCRVTAKNHLACFSIESSKVCATCRNTEVNVEIYQLLLLLHFLPPASSISLFSAYVNNLPQIAANNRNIVVRNIRTKTHF